MSKKKRPKNQAADRQKWQTPQPKLDPKQQGLRAFESERFDAAIVAWSSLPQSEVAVTNALAEAYFRRAISRTPKAQPSPANQAGLSSEQLVTQISDLRQALVLAPNELRYKYHLAMALHRSGDLSAASEYYRAILQSNQPTARPTTSGPARPTTSGPASRPASQNDPNWQTIRYGAEAALALATLEQDHQADLTKLPGSTPAIRAKFAPVQSLLRQTPAKKAAKASAGRSADRSTGGRADREAEPAPRLAGRLAVQTNDPVTGQLESLWQDLSKLQAGEKDDILNLFEDSQERLVTLTSPSALKVRRYYKGIAAALAGDMETALKAWQRVYEVNPTECQPWLRDNLIAAMLNRLAANKGIGGRVSGDGGVSSDTPAGRQHLTPDTLSDTPELLPDVGIAEQPPSYLIALASGNAALSEAVIEHFDQAAHYSVSAGRAEKADWPRAIRLWEVARQVLSQGGSTLGSPRPILHNLALGYEAQEQWVEAAELWRALLRTRNRRTEPPPTTQVTPAAPQPPPTAENSTSAGRSAEPRNEQLEKEDQAATSSRTAASLKSESGWSDKQWNWVRKRVIECYKHAKQPEEAVAVYRQAIKAEPNDFELRLQFVEALIANEQVQAAFNELYRLVQLEPKHIEANLRLSKLESEFNAGTAAEIRIRKLREYYPDREDLRLHLAQLLFHHSEEQHARGLLQQAKEKLEEGQKLAPKDYKFPIGLARIAIDQRSADLVPVLLEQALELGADQPRAYINVIECWSALDKVEEIRTILARIEAKLPPDPAFYIDLAMTILTRKTVRPRINPFSFLSAPKEVSPVDSTWPKLVLEILQRATNIRPDDLAIQTSIATALSMVRPDMALPFAREVVRLKPDDPNGGMMLGLILGLNDQGREAKEVLRKAARQARQQGDMELYNQIESTRQQIENPFFKMLPNIDSMADLFDELDIDDFF